MSFVSERLEDPGGLRGTAAGRVAIEAAELQAGAITEAARISAASQREALEALREQLGMSREDFEPFLQAGGAALAGLTEGFQGPRGATAAGLDANLAEIMSGESFQSLLGERQRGLQGQLAAGGLTRSGTALQESARLPTSLAFDIENQLFGRQTSQEVARIQGLQNLGQMGLSAAAQTGGIGGGLTQSISQQLSGIGMTQAQGLTGAAQASAAGMLGASQAAAQGRQNMLGLVASLFSDPRLKTNIEVVGKVGPLDLVTWDWIPELEDSFVKDFPTIGYLSTQVKEHYPQYVGEFGSYDTINYHALDEELLSG